MMMLLRVTRRHQEPNQVAHLFWREDLLKTFWHD